MLVRLLAAIIFTAAGAAGGAAYSLRLCDDCTKCRDICAILRKISVYIRYTGSDVYEIARLLKNEDMRLSFVQNLPESFFAGENFHAQWREALLSEKLPPDEFELLDELGKVIGTSDIDGQLAEISALEVQAERLMSQRSENYRQKGKMCRSVGVLAGVMVGVLVI